MWHADRSGVVDRVAAQAVFIGIALYAIALFNPHLTAPRNTGFYLAWLAALVLMAVRVERTKRLLREPLFLVLLLVCVGVVWAVFRSPDVRYSAWQAYKEWVFVLVAAFAVALACVTPRELARLGYAFVLAGLSLNLMNLAQYLIEWARAGSLSDNIHLHRFYADSLLWFLPWTLWIANQARRPWHRMLGLALVALQFVLLAGTGARGAWVAAIVVVAIWIGAMRPTRGAVLAMAVALLVAVALAAAVIPKELFVERLAQGATTSARTEGTWAPAVALIQERLWAGYGFGAAIFHNAYNARVALEPSWVFERSMGPHNVYLSLWFAGGIALLLAFVALLALAASAVRSARRSGDASLAGVALAAALSIAGTIAIRGLVEDVPMRSLGLALGVLLACVIHARESREKAA